MLYFLSIWELLYIILFLVIKNNSNVYLFNNYSILIYSSDKFKIKF